MTSPPARVARARQVVMLIESRKKRTLPSASDALTPPENGLRELNQPWPCPATSGVVLFGVRAAVKPLV